MVIWVTQAVIAVSSPPLPSSRCRAIPPQVRPCVFDEHEALFSVKLSAMSTLSKDTYNLAARAEHAETKYYREDAFLQAVEREDAQCSKDCWW